MKKILLSILLLLTIAGVAQVQRPLRGGGSGSSLWSQGSGYISPATSSNYIYVSNKGSQFGPAPGTLGNTLSVNGKFRIRPDSIVDYTGTPSYALTFGATGLIEKGAWPTGGDTLNIPFYYSGGYILPRQNLHTGIGSVINPFHVFSIGANYSNRDAFNFVDTFWNKNRTTLAQAKDSSSYSGMFTKTGKPELNLSGNLGVLIWKLDSTNLLTHTGTHYNYGFNKSYQYYSNAPQGGQMYFRNKASTSAYTAWMETDTTGAATLANLLNIGDLTQASGKRHYIGASYLSNSGSTITVSGSMSFGGSIAPASIVIPYQSGTIQIGMGQSSATDGIGSIGVNASAGRAGQSNQSAGILYLGPYASAKQTTTNTGTTSVEMMRSGRASTSGSTENPVAQAYIVTSEKPLVNKNDTASNVCFTIVAANSTAGKVFVHYSLTMANGTTPNDSIQGVGGTVRINWVKNGAGTYYTTVTDTQDAADSRYNATSAGTFTATWEVYSNPAGGILRVYCRPVASVRGSAATNYAKLYYDISNGSMASITQQ